ncbi:MAG: division/cell wall cluster transcriptional repressor MraZ [Thiotrichales bacterium]
MFRGVSNLVLDDKNRLSVPARYRDEIMAACEGNLIVTVDPDRCRCLLIYPFPEWQRIEQQLMSRPNMDPGVRKLQRLMVGHATDCELSAQSRILIPEPLRNFVQLDKRVVLVGQGKRFELWNEQRWTAECDDYLREAAQDEVMSEAIASLSI